MHNKSVIRFSNVSKVYKLYDKPSHRLKESINPFGASYHKDFYALKDISFTIHEGETVGILGKNGSGKSTLLKIITGILTATSGEVHIQGKISALLELGAGFNPEYTGIENIFLNGTIMGITRTEMEDKLDDILSFADIGDFVYQPVKTYSSGMFVRLAFAVAINVDPEILIVDEALSVGDVRFQQKCLRKIEEFKNKGKTVLFVSHDLGTIVKFCDRVIWINEGEMLDDGDPLDIAKKYQAFMMDSPLSKYNSTTDTGRQCATPEEADNIDDLEPSLDVHGDTKAKIVGISLFDTLTDNKLPMVGPGQRVKLSIKVLFNESLDEPIVGFSIKDRLGNTVTQSNSYVLRGALEPVPEGAVAVYSFRFAFPNLTSGHYSVSPAIASGSQSHHVQHCWVHDALVVEVINNQLYQLPGFIFIDDINFDHVG